MPERVIELVYLVSASALPLMRGVEPPVAKDVRVWYVASITILESIIQVRPSYSAKE